MTGAAIGGIFATVNRYCSARLWRPPASPLNIVVTGSTRGLGKALAREFLAHGDSVVITGRTPAAVTQAIAEVKQELAGFGLSAVGSLHRGGSKKQQAVAAAGSTAGSSSSSGPRLYGVVCDVTQAQSVADLATQAQVRLITWACPLAHLSVDGPLRQSTRNLASIHSCIAFWGPSNPSAFVLTVVWAGLVAAGAAGHCGCVGV